jgi:DNA-binding LytR/AlgR family response regulator
MELSVSVLRVVIVDDEPLARARLERMCGRIAEVEVVGQAGDGKSALELIAEAKPSLVLLDVQMPGLDGVGVAEECADSGASIVFTTAYAHFAADAFNVDAVDYLLKPVIQERLVRAVAKVRRARAVGAPVARSEERPNDDASRLIVQERGVTRVFDVHEIKHFHATEKYVEFVCDGEKHETRESLASLAERLAPLGFARVHRAEMVKLACVRSVLAEAGGSATLVLDDGTRVPVSRRSAADVRRLIGL